MAAILYDNRTLQFGDGDDLLISELEITQAIRSSHPGFSDGEVTTLVAELIDALAESIEG